MVLLKPGADVLAMTFRLVPQFAVTRTDLGDGHREYDVTCSMYSADGAMLGQGVGSASTMEKKYRYRKEYCENGAKKDSYNKRYNDVENTDIADVYNTVLKIAKKRAHIDATLTVTGAADLFTQDLIDEDAEPPKQAPAMPTRKAEPQATAAKPEAKQAPQVAGPVGDTVTGLVEVVTSKPTAKGNKRYGIKVDGVWYNTFSDTDGTTAADCKAAGIPVRIVYVTNAKGYNDIAEGGLAGVQELGAEQATGGELVDDTGRPAF
jgi:hypothetical protein